MYDLEKSKRPRISPKLVREVFRRLVEIGAIEPSDVKVQTISRSTFLLN